MEKISFDGDSDIPLEYHVFALCMQQPGAINRFAAEIDPQIVGKIHGKTGLYEFYLAFLDFHKQTGLDIVDPVAFKSWLGNETQIPDSLGGIGGVSFFLDQLLNIDLASTDSVIRVLRARAAKRQQMDDLKALKSILEKKGPKSEAELEQIAHMTERIRTVESQLDYNPFDVVDNAFDIAARADVLGEIPEFIKTPFKQYNKVLGYCVDPKTEILTQDGWVTYEHLKPGETHILAYSKDSDSLQWEPLKDIYINEDYHGDMVRLKSLNFSAYTTPHHKWAIKKNPTDPEDSVVMKRTFELPKYGGILRNGTFTGVDETLSDAFVKLCAWYYTEGSMLDQGYKGSHVKSWGLSGSDVLDITSFIRGKDKVPSPEFIAALSARQARLFVETAKKGDGTKGTNQFHQHNARRMDAYAAIAVLAGFTVTLDSSGTTCTTSHKHAALNKIDRETREYRGTIWCPLTYSGYWVARRDGKVYITGNTDEGGYFRGAVHAIVGRSGIGKSTLAKSLCNFWLDEGMSVLFINYEEAQDHWERILMTQIIGENVYATASSWSENDRRNKLMTFTEKLEEWGDRLMIRHDPDTSYFEDLELWLRDIIGHDSAPDVVVIDTINSLFTKGSGSARWGEYEKMMVRLEKLAKDMNAVFVITVQQNAEASREKREVLEQRDVGGSATIVQKCSVVTFLTDKQLAGADESLAMDSVIQLQIPKNRITGKVFMQDPPLLKYVDETKSYEDWNEIDDADMLYVDDDTSLADEILGTGDFNQ